MHPNENGICLVSVSHWIPALKLLHYGDLTDYLWFIFIAVISIVFTSVSALSNIKLKGIILQPEFNFKHYLPGDLDWYVIRNWDPCKTF